MPRSSGTQLANILDWARSLRRDHCFVGKSHADVGCDDTTTYFRHSMKPTDTYMMVSLPSWRRRLWLQARHIIVSVFETRYGLVFTLLCRRGSCGKKDGVILLLSAGWYSSYRGTALFV